MLELLRIAVCLPLLIGDAIWSRITRNAEEEAIAAQRRRFQEMAEGR